jgi:carboxymethylenebutenolidase
MNLFQNYLVEEFAEDYQEGHLSRREALKLIFSVTGSMLITNSILAACAPPPEATLPPAAMASATQAPAASTTQAASKTPLPSATAAATTTGPAATPTGAVDTPTAEPTEPPAETAAPGNTAVQTADIEFPGDGATLLGTLSTPAGEGR